MNKIFLLLCCCYGLLTQAQQPFRDLSFKGALKKAARQNKLLFIQITSDNCIQCNDVANKAFGDPLLKKRLSKEFIAIRVGESTADGMEAAALFERENGFGTPIIDRNKSPVYQFNKTTSRSADYFQVLDSAASNKQKIDQLKILESAYFSAKNKDWHILEALIQNKTALGQNTGLLLNEYLHLLPKDSLTTQHVVYFLAGQSPIVGSEARTLMYKDHKLFEQVWNSMPQVQRTLLNKRTISKSMNIAVFEKNEPYARQVAAFAAGTYPLQARDGIYDLQLLNYYYRTADTVRYLQLGHRYYNQDFGAQTDERINQIQEAQLRAAFSEATTDTVTGANGMRRMIRSASVPSYRSGIASRMNHAAEAFYRMDRKGIYLTSTLAWIKRSVEIYPTANNMDTYARLLYRSGEKELAVSYEEQAVEASRKQGIERKEWNTVIEKMKQNAAID